MKNDTLISNLTVDELTKVISKVVSDEFHRLVDTTFIIEDGVKISILPDNEDDLQFKDDFEDSLLYSLEQVKSGKTIALHDFREKNRI